MGFELDYGKDVFEADDMVEREGVEGRRRGGEESRVCFSVVASDVPCGRPVPIDE